MVLWFKTVLIISWYEILYTIFELFVGAMISKMSGTEDASPVSSLYSNHNLVGLLRINLLS